MSMVCPPDTSSASRLRGEQPGALDARAIDVQVQQRLKDVRAGVDVRAEKAFRFANGQRLLARVNVFNVTNVNTILSWTTASGSRSLPRPVSQAKAEMDIDQMRGDGNRLVRAEAPAPQSAGALSPAPKVDKDGNLWATGPGGVNDEC